MHISSASTTANLFTRKSASASQALQFGTTPPDSLEKTQPEWQTKLHPDVLANLQNVHAFQAQLTGEAKPLSATDWVKNDTNSPADFLSALYPPDITGISEDATIHTHKVLLKSIFETGENLVQLLPEPTQHFQKTEKPGFFKRIFHALSTWLKQLFGPTSTVPTKIPAAVTKPAFTLTADFEQLIQETFKNRSANTQPTTAKEDFTAIIQALINYEGTSASLQEAKQTIIETRLKLPASVEIAQDPKLLKEFTNTNNFLLMPFIKLPSEEKTAFVTNFSLTQQGNALSQQLLDKAQQKFKFRQLRQQAQQGLGWMSEQHAQQLNAKLDQTSTLHNPTEAHIRQRQLDYLISLPWQYTSKDAPRPTMAQAKATLDAELLGIDRVKSKLLALYATEQQQRQHTEPSKQRGKIICLVGGYGMGKTHLAEAYAKATGKQFAKIELGGVNSSQQLQGFSSTYIGSEPGLIVKALKRHNVTHMDNTVILLDEIDKVGQGRNSHHGDPMDALNHLLDPDHNHRFEEKFLDTTIDFSRATLIVTANNLNEIPGHIKDRMEIITVPGYTMAQQRDILTQKILPNVRKAHGLSEADWPDTLFTPQITQALVQDYANGSIRTLTQKVEALAKHRAEQLQVARETGQTAPEARLTLTDLPTILETKRRRNKVEHYGTLEQGMVQGLSYSRPYYGNIHRDSVSVILKPAKEATAIGKLTSSKDDLLPKSFGDQMTDSIQETFQVIHTRWENINALLKQKNLPQMTIPKGYEATLAFSHECIAEKMDGPSGGLAYTLAAISALSGIRLRADYAMTGRILPNGEVGWISGLATKIEAAYQAGQTINGKEYRIRTILIPHENAVYAPDGKTVIGAKEANEDPPVPISPEILDPNNPHHIKLVAVKNLKDALDSGILSTESGTVNGILPDKLGV